MEFQIFDNYKHGKSARLTCDKCGRKQYTKIKDVDFFLEQEAGAPEGWQIFLGLDGNMKTLCPGCKEETKFVDRPLSIFNLMGWKETRFDITCAKPKMLGDRDKAMELDLYELGAVCPTCFHEKKHSAITGKMLL